MPVVRHELTADGMVRLVIPASGLVTDADARRLAWGILNDLAPDEVVPVAEVVGKGEALRLDILRAVASGARTAGAICRRLNRRERHIQRRLQELVGDGRLISSHAGSGGPAKTYSLSTERGEAAHGAH